MDHLALGNGIRLDCRLQPVLLVSGPTICSSTILSTVPDDHIQSLVTCTFKARGITCQLNNLNLNLATQADSSMRSSPMDTQEEGVHNIPRPPTPDGLSPTTQSTHATPIRHRGTSSAAVSDSKQSAVFSQIKYVLKSGSHSLC